MKAFCLLPAVVWALGLLVIAEWSEHNMALDGRKMKPESSDAFCTMWWGGTLLLALLGWMIA